MATRNFVPRADGEGSLGTSGKKWGDVQAVKATIANVTGKATEAGTADTATKLSTARTIALSGDATGSVTFDGSSDATIATEVSKIGGTAVSDFIKTLLDDGDAATARATLEANAQNCGGIVAASLTNNGYVKFANGLILEWGAFINNTGTQISEGEWHKTVTFPITNSGAAGSWNVWSFTNFEQDTSWVWSQGYSSENGKLLVKYQHGVGQFLIHWFIVSFT